MSTLSNPQNKEDGVHHLIARSGPSCAVLVGNKLGASSTGIVRPPETGLTLLSGFLSVMMKPALRADDGDASPADDDFQEEPGWDATSFADGNRTAGGRFDFVGLDTQ